MDVRANKGIKSATGAPKLVILQLFKVKMANFGALVAW